MNQHLNLDPDLAYKIREVAQRCERQRRSQGWLRYGIFLLVVLCVGTFLSLLIGETLWRNLVILAFLIAAFMGFRRWLWPLYKHPLSDEQIALFIDEHYPELQNRIVSMVALSKVARGKENSWLIRRFLRESQSFVRESALSYEDRYRFKARPAFITGGIYLAIPILLIAFAHLWMPVFKWEPAVDDKGYTVSPGNARVQMGDDITIFVKSSVGSRSVRVEWRDENNAWNHADMRLGEADGVYFHTLKHVSTPTDYRVHFGGETSPTYRLTPWVAPEVTTIDLTYHYPEYLGKEQRHVPNGGDITAIEHTKVRMRATVNKPLSELDLVLVTDDSRIAFTATEDPLVWQGELTVTRNDNYYFLPLDKERAEGIYRPEYKITMQEDKAPRLRVSFPFRDMEVSPLDEVSFDFKVSDDFGIQDYGIRYHVADREPVDVSLMKEPNQREVSATATHQLMLEELNLQAGDLLTWSIWAKDGKPDRSEMDQLGDPFFLEIRPFKRLFRQAISNSGGQQGGGGGDPLSKQKEVLIATWNLRKEANHLSPDVYEERRAIIAETQGIVEKMVEQMLSMSGQADSPDAKVLVKAIANALDALDDAKDKEKAHDTLGTAAEHEQIAYRSLLRLAPKENQMGQSRGQSGGDQSRQLAGMEDLEMQRNRNYYEEEKLTQQQQEATAEALDKIKDLAQRQKMLNQEIAKLISEMEQGKLDEKEVKRRLERLKEEARKNLEELDQTRREISTSEMDTASAQSAQKKLDEVRERMNRELEKMRPESLQQARAAGSEALENLDKLEEELQEQTSGSAKERMAQLQQKMADLQEQQQQIQEKINELGDEKDSPKLTANDPSQEKKTQLMEDKKKLAEEFRDLMEDASSVANMTRGDKEHLSRKLGDWLRQTSRDGIGEDMDKSSTLARFGVWEELAEKEAEIAEKLEKAAKGLERVAQQSGGDELQTRQQALQELQALEDMAPQPGQNPTAEMERLASENYKEWMEGLRNAEGLLGNGQHSRNIVRMRREIEKMRRKYRRDNLIPKYDAFTNKVLNPLKNTIEELQREVTALQENRAFVLTDDSSIPENYRKQVAEYFQVLAESEGN